MEEKKEILSIQEKTGTPQKLPPKERWYKEMSRSVKKDFYSTLLIFPLMFFVTVFFMTGVIVNLPITYVALGIVTVWCYRSNEIKRLEEQDEIERVGDRTEILLQKIAELKEIDRERMERIRQEAIEKERKAAAGRAKWEAAKQIVLSALPHFHNFNQFPENTNLRV